MTDALRHLQALLDSAVLAVTPGAVLRLSRGPDEVFLGAVGTTATPASGLAPSPVHADTVFDLASVTKPLATTAIAALLVGEGRVALEDPAGRYVPGLPPPWSHVTLAHLLAHTSGLPAWRPYAEDLVREHGPSIAGSPAARDAVLARIGAEAPQCPPGAACTYSDLGFIVLGTALEHAGGESLDDAFARRVAAPLGLARTFFVRVRGGVPAPAPVPAPDLSATAWSPVRGRLLRGEVDDDNAWVLGGVAGHAGLFSTARETAAIAAAFADAWAGRASPLPRGVVRRLWSRDFTPPGSTRLLGWDTPSPVGSQAGDRAPAGTVGHLGFTGTSVWLHPDSGACVVLLTNRVHPDRASDGIRAFRARVHDAAWKLLPP